MPKGRKFKLLWLDHLPRKVDQTTCIKSLTLHFHDMEPWLADDAMNWVYGLYFGRERPLCHDIQFQSEAHAYKVHICENKF